MTKKQFSISSFNTQHAQVNQMLEDFKEQAATNWNNLFPKMPVTKKAFDGYSGNYRFQSPYYNQFFYGDDLVGYLGYEIGDGAINITEFYLEDKFLTAKYLKEIVSFMKKVANKHERSYIMIDVFNLQKLVAKLKLLKLKTATSSMYLELE